MPETQVSTQEAQDELQECAEECLTCHAACTITLQHCLATGGRHADVNLIGILLDCAELCQTSANFMLRGSPYHLVTCAACAELCRACEEVCNAVGAIGGDEQMAHCAEVCHSCAVSCERMADAAHAA
jgi:hypothetical protein